MNYFITAIGTDSGKTMIAAALAQAINADYWKPIQAGYPTDTEEVEKLTQGEVYCHYEQFVFKTPASPHYASTLDGISFQLTDIKLPQSKKSIVIEGAGGCMVPINDSEFIIDMVPTCKSEIILISNNYLGSINHTMLTLELIKKRGYPLKAIIFNGPPNPATEEVIMKNTTVPCFYKVPKMNDVNIETIRELSAKFKTRWNELGW